MAAKHSGQREEPLYPEYWMVETPFTCYSVSTPIARVIQRELGRWPRRRWISFVDISGARVLLQANWILSLEQSSPDIRAMWRRIAKERKQENPEIGL